MPDVAQDRAEVLGALRESVESTGANAVFGEPARQDGITVLPVARVRGAGHGRGAGQLVAAVALLTIRAIV
jgi:uncharacterized spore protein YtfJ